LEPTAVPLADAIAAVPRPRERLVIAALALVAFALNLNTNVLGSLLPFFLTGDLAPLYAGKEWLISAAAWGSALGALTAGVWSDRRGRKVPLCAGLAVFIVASGLHLAVVSFWPVLVLRALSGFAVGVAYAPASALVAELVPYDRRGAAMGAFTAGMFLAIPLGMPIAVWLAQVWTWSGVFLVQAGVAAVGLVLALRLVPANTGTGTWRSPWPLLRQTAVVAALVATLLHVGSFFTTVQFAAPWLAGAGLLPREQHIQLWVAFGLTSAVGSFALGRAADGVGKRNFVLLASMVLAGCFLLLTRVSAPSSMLVLGFLLATVAAARTGPLQALTSGLVPPHELGALMGLRAFAMQCGIGALVLVAGPLFTAASRDAGITVRSLDPVLLLAAGCQVASYAAIRFGIRRLR
jgi:predicted MFS family arabinose efflux permease